MTQQLNIMTKLHFSYGSGHFGSGKHIQSYIFKKKILTTYYLIRKQESSVKELPLQITLENTKKCLWKYHYKRCPQKR